MAKMFGFNPATMTLRKEVIGGITTFLTMAYILAVNPSILSATGMDAGAVFTTTCISAVVATLVMALYAKLPFALAPGMGLNAFFAFTVVLTMGYSWQFALTAVLIEGIIFILLTITGLRQYIVNAIPQIMRRAISPGIGLIIAYVGLKSVGIVTSSEATFRPWRFSMTSMKVDASESESWVPVSSHAKPRCSVCTSSSFLARYSWLTVVISSSPRAEGLMCLAISTTLLG